MLSWVSDYAYTDDAPIFRAGAPVVAHVLVDQESAQHEPNNARLSSAEGDDGDLAVGAGAVGAEA